MWSHSVLLGTPKCFPIDTYRPLISVNKFSASTFSQSSKYISESKPQEFRLWDWLLLEVDIIISNIFIYLSFLFFHQISLFEMFLAGTSFCLCSLSCASTTGFVSFRRGKVKCVIEHFHGYLFSCFRISSY